uniref:pectinesterase n=1 Tax=Quercus lobata TaxID=97700 RepID=A0A7N2LYQ5_QUELO
MTINIHSSSQKTLTMTMTMRSTSLFFFLSLLSLSSASNHDHSTSNTNAAPTPPSSIQQLCKAATRFPDLCVSSLSNSKQLPPNPTPLQLIYSSLSVTSEIARTVQSKVNDIINSAAGDQNRTRASNNCLEALKSSLYRISITTNDALPRGNLKSARTWMSASLLHHTDCASALTRVNDTKLVTKTLSLVDSLINITSNALSLLFSYDHFGNNTASWIPPRTERDGFWGPVKKSGIAGFKGGVPENLKVDVTAGVYEEIVRVPLEKKNVVFLGDGIGKTVITGSLYVGLPGISTSSSATVAVLGDGFMASGITFQNTAGVDKDNQSHQAVAFKLSSDFSVIENCEFLGNQDTLFAQTLRQFYKSCRIVGIVDFVFGNAAAFFQDCQIIVKPRQAAPEKGEKNYMTAHGRTDPAQTTGYVFYNCLINGTEEYMKLYHGASKPEIHSNFLGRPWKEYARTVYIQSSLQELVSPQGWLPWNTDDFALKTLYFGEFQNSGPGFTPPRRVNWSNQIPAEQVQTYSVENFIQGDLWIPSS